MRYFYRFFINDPGAGAAMALILLAMGVILVIFHPAMKNPRKAAAPEEIIITPNTTSP